ncbi:MAG: hypothetical protein K0U74_12685 [Alphaproteobacteria bacterium]|nr:hypothetical protein [Alphaproteobacteria bacterium]
MASQDHSAGTQAAQAYKDFIDQAVETACKPGFYGHWVSTNGRLPVGRDILSKPRKENERFNRFVESLDTDQRLYVAQLLSKERQEAIHEVLANIEWLITADGFGLTKNGMELDTEIYWDITHDFAGRLAGQRWPDEPGEGKAMVRWVENPQTNDD